MNNEEEYPTKIRVIKNLFSGLFIVYLAIALLLPISFASDENVVAKQGEEIIGQGRFGQINTHDVTLSKGEQVSLLVRTNTPIPVQGRLTNSSGSARNNIQIHVCINDSSSLERCANASTDGNGLFQADVSYFLEDPHAVHYLNIWLGGDKTGQVLVSQETFYPAGGPQGNLVVNGILTVNQELNVAGQPVCLGNGTNCPSGNPQNIWYTLNADSPPSITPSTSSDSLIFQGGKGIVTSVISAPKTIKFDLINCPSAGQILKWNGTGWECNSDVSGDADSNSTNEIQVLGINGNNLTLSLGGGSVLVPFATLAGGVTWGNVTNRPDFYSCSGANQSIKTLNLSTGAVSCETDDVGSVAETDPVANPRIDSINASLQNHLTIDQDLNSTNEIQTLGISGNNITLSLGGSILVPFATLAASVTWGNVTSKPANITSCSGGNLSVKTVDFATGTVTCETDDIGAPGTTSNSFETISAPAGTNPVADSATDTLTLTNGAGIAITGNSAADSITIASTVTPYPGDCPADAVRVFGTCRTLPGCNSSNQKVIYDNVTDTFSCQTDAQGITTETDPEVGIANVNQLCYGQSGNVVECNDEITWNPANNRLGIGVANPQSDLHVRDTNGSFDFIMRIEDNKSTSMNIFMDNLYTTGGVYSLFLDASGEFGIEKYPTGPGFSERVFTVLSTGSLNALHNLTVNERVGATQYCDENLLNCKTITQLTTDNITGTGTPNYIPKWLTSGTLATSIIYENNSKIGIGTTSPTAKLEIKDSSSAPTGNMYGLNVSLLSTSGVTSLNTYGIYGSTSNTGAASTGNAYGGYFQSNSVATISPNVYGVFANASGGLNAYGIYATASGGTNNWSGYFDDGKVYMKNNLGIGTKTPFSTYTGTFPKPGVHINGTSPVIGLEDSDNGERWFLEAGPGGFGIFNDNDAASAILIDNNENIGIGGVVPTTKLQVKGNFCVYDGNCSNITIGGSAFDPTIFSVGPNDVFFGNNRVIINGDSIPGPVFSATNFQDTSIEGTHTADITYWGSSTNTTNSINIVALTVGNLGKLKNGAQHYALWVGAAPYNQTNPNGTSVGLRSIGGGGIVNTGAHISAWEGNNSSSALANTGIYVDATNAINNTAIYASATGGNLNYAGYFDQGNVHVENDLQIFRMWFIDQSNDQAYPDGWIGMANNSIEGTKKFLHVGGITDAGGDNVRRIGLFGDKTMVSGSLCVGTNCPSVTPANTGDIFIGKAAGTEANHLVCYTSDAKLGYCTTNPDGTNTGICTCSALTLT